MGFTDSKIGKKHEKPLLGQILDLIPRSIFINSVSQYQSDKHCSTYKTKDEFKAMLFGQLNKCLSLREISMELSITPEFLKDIGLEQSPAKSTMSDGNAKRDYRVFEQVYFKLIEYYKDVFSKRPEYKMIEEIKGKNIKIIDSTTMSVCLKLFSWAKFRTAKGGIKIHTSLDEALMIPDMIHISEAKVSDRRGVDNFRYKEDTIVVDDRGYFDFKLFKTRIEDKNHFVTRIKYNTLYESVVENELSTDKDFHVLKDEIIYLTGKAAKDSGIYLTQLRRVAVASKRAIGQ